jgi:hypothetical protein
VNVDGDRDGTRNGRSGILTVVSTRLILAEAVKKYDAPRGVVHDLLLDPGTWLRLREGEVLPVALDGTTPDHLSWTSLWPSLPHDSIVFELSPWATPSDGTALRYRWLAHEPIEERTAGMVRYRLEYLFGDVLRAPLFEHTWSRRESLPIN